MNKFIKKYIRSINDVTLAFKRGNRTVHFGEKLQSSKLYN